VPGVAAAFTRAQLLGSDDTTPYLKAMRRSWVADLSAPLMLVNQPGWMFSSRAEGATHGSPYRYDTQVPILAWGPAWFGQGEVKSTVYVADIAPTLSQLLHIPAPEQSQGQVLPIPAMTTPRTH